MGMFDTIHFNCPNCGAANEYQSKIGDCSLRDYSISDAPLLVIADLHDESNKDRLYCSYCNNKIHIRVRFLTTVSCDNISPTDFREV